MPIPSSPEHQANWAQGPINPANRPNQRVGIAGRLMLTGAVLVGALSSSDLPAQDEYFPNPEPVPELYCADDAANIEGQIDNWVHGGVEQVWIENEESVGSMILSYNLQTGENLSQVASCFYEDLSEGLSVIAASNNIQDINVVKPGKLKIPINRPQSFKLSEKISSVQMLAFSSGFSAEQIYAANGLIFNLGVKDLWDPKPGDTVFLPLQKKSEPSSEVTVPGDIKLPEEQPDEPIIEDNQEAEEALASRDEELREFKKKWGSYAEDIEKKYGIDHNVVLAQAIIESRYGTSELAIKAKALFGIKAHEGAATTEYWAGKRYPKVTKENLTDQQLKAEEFADHEVIGDKVKGKTPVKVSQYFREYDSEQDSFLDYANRIATFPPYEAVYASRADPRVYIKKIAPIYATDPDYAEKLELVYLDLESLEEPQAPELEAEIEQTIAEKINSVELNPEGYRRFLTTINKDYINYASKKGAFQGGGLTQGKATDMFTLHFTALFYNGIGTGEISRPVGSKTDVEHFITSIDNTDGENCCGVQWLIGRDGTLYQLVDDPDTRLMHNAPFSEVSEGVEIEQIDQKGITSKQYETAAYLAAYRLSEKGLGADELKGHAEIRAAVNEERARSGKKKLPGRSDFPAEETALLRAKVEKLLKSL